MLLVNISSLIPIHGPGGTTHHVIPQETVTINRGACYVMERHKETKMDEQMNKHTNIQTS